MARYGISFVLLIVLLYGRGGMTSSRFLSDFALCIVDTELSSTVTTPTPTSTPQTSTPQTSTPQTSTPQTSTPQTSTPQTSTPQTSTPQTSTPQTSTPQTSTPQTSTPQTSTPQTSTPQTSTPQTSTPQTSTPQTSTPQTSTPQTSTPQTSTPQTSTPQTSTPQTSTPQTSTPQTSTPQTSTPQTSTPQTSTPQTSTPQTSTPQTSTPQTSTPQTSTPQTSTPQTSTPQTSTPQTSTPQTSTPQTSTPQTSTPQTSTPQTSTPQTSTPQTSTPQTSTPQTSTPQTSTPQTSTPQTSTPQTSTPQTSTPQTSTPQTSTPQTSTPQTSTPQTSTPQTSTPQTSTSHVWPYFRVAPIPDQALIFSADPVVERGTAGTYDEQRGLIKINEDGTYSFIIHRVGVSTMMSPFLPLLLDVKKNTNRIVTIAEILDNGEGSIFTANVLAELKRGDSVIIHTQGADVIGEGNRPFIFTAYLLYHKPLSPFPKPRQSAFSVPAIANLSIADSIIDDFDLPTVNIGEGFDSLTGVFTARFGGLYVFHLVVTFTPTNDGSSGRSSIALEVNGDIIARVTGLVPDLVFRYDYLVSSHTGITVVQELNHGDKVSLRNIIEQEDIEGKVMFVGYLL